MMTDLRRVRARFAVALLAIFATGTGGGCGEASSHEAPSSSPAIDAVQLEQLEALGYAQWTDGLEEEHASRSGVIYHDPTKTYPGVNLYSREHGAQAFLIDMEGKVLHKWESTEVNRWVLAKLQPNNDLLVISRHNSLVRFDWDSNVVWETDLLAHHDLSVGEAGRIYALRKNKDFEPVPEGVMPIILEGIAVLDSSGTVEREFDINPLFPEAAPEPTIEAVEIFAQANPEVVKGKDKDKGDLFLDTLHSNSILALPRDVEGLGSQGDLLVSMRRIDTIAVIDPSGKRVLWSWGPGDLRRQHHPTLLDNGNLLIFDNGAPDRLWTRIIEYSPTQDEIVWQYKADPPEDFYCNSRGSAQMLPNGNVLVTDSASGRVFEITRAGEVVWEFLNPVMREKDDNVRRETIYRMTRISDDVLASLPLKILARE
jgi:hypothetical protein